jgi:hypothetical protein
MQDVPAEFFSFDGIPKQKTEQSASVKTTTPDTAPHLGLWRR